MAVNHLLVLFLFLLTFKTGFSAEISVFVQTGDSVQLDIKTEKLPEFDDLYWTNDKSENIVKYTNEIKKVKSYSSYKNRMDFSNKTFSLTLKNMQKTDSGLYKARTSGESENTIVAYRVSVIDAVEAPVLTVNSNWSSSDSCTVNFTCRAHDLTINSSYQNNRCFPEEVTSHENYSLILYCSKESIICNHSNPVSWKKDRKGNKQLCVNNKENDSDVHKTSELSLQFWPYILLGIFLAIAIFLLFLLHKYKTGAQETNSTIYDQVETQEMQEINSEGHTHDAPELAHNQMQEETGDNLPSTTYCTVGQHQKPAVTIETDRTIYATVCKPSHTISFDKA